MSLLFVTGAGTDIGKTFVSVLMIREARAAGRAVRVLKPVISGVPDIDDPAFAETDTARLLSAAGQVVGPETIDRCSPWRFAAPLSPDMAAAAEGRSVALAAVVAVCRAEAEAYPDALVLVEGAGGVMSPIASDGLNIDLIAALGCPAVLVGGSYLGALSHTLSALFVLRARGVPVERVVVNETPGSGVDFEATLRTFERFAGGALLRALRRQPA